MVKFLCQPAVTLSLTDLTVNTKDVQIYHFNFHSKYQVTFFINLSCKQLTLSCKEHRCQNWSKQQRSRFSERSQTTLKRKGGRQSKNIEFLSTFIVKRCQLRGVGGQKAQNLSKQVVNAPLEITVWVTRFCCCFGTNFYLSYSQGTKQTFCTRSFSSFWFSVLLKVL